MELSFVNDIKKSNKSCSKYEGVKRYIDTGNVKGTKIVGFEEYTYDNKPSRANVCVKSGDVLVAKMQNSIKVLIIDEETENYVFSTGFYAFRDKRILPAYLKHFFISPYFNHEKDIKCTGGTQKAINDEGMKKIFINVPSLQEQAAIVEKLDLISEAIECEEDRIQLYDELVKSKFLELFGNPLTPQEFYYLEDIALLERGKFSPRPRNDPKYFNGEYPYIQTGDISSSEHRLRNHTQTLNELGIKVSKKFNIGTIVIAIVGATVGATAILEKEVYAPDSVIGITPYEYNNIFLETLLQFWRKELLAIAPDCARANINLEILGKVPILKVDIDKQNDFAEFVQILDNEKQNVKNIKRYFEELQVNEMHKYFE